MLTDEEQRHLRRVLLPMQIIVGALAFGIAVFFVVAVALVARNPGGAAPNVPFLTYIGIAFTGMGAVGSYLLPKFIGVRSIAIGKSPPVVTLQSIDTRLGDVQALVSHYQTQTIIGAALLEGTAFFNLVAYLIEHQQISLAMAGVSLLLLLAKFPTLGRLRNRIEDDLATLKQLRAMGSRHG